MEPLRSVSRSAYMPVEGEVFSPVYEHSLGVSSLIADFAKLLSSRPRLSVV
jgi:hypothetical protein